MLIFRSGKPQYLVSQPSSFLTCSMEKKCSPIHLTALHRSLPQSPRLSFSFSHIPSLLFAHLNALSPEFLCSASYICLIFASNSLGFQLFLSSVFSYFLHKLSSPPPGPHTRSILLGFARPILLLFICSCVWIELSTSASGEALKKERKKRKRTKYNTQESLPLRVHHKLDSKHEGPSPCNPLFSILLGGKCVRRAGQPCNLKLRVTEHKAL